jgi:hypothetical protein
MDDLSAAASISCLFPWVALYVQSPAVADVQLLFRALSQAGMDCRAALQATAQQDAPGSGMGPSSPGVSGENLTWRQQLDATLNDLMQPGPRDLADALQPAGAVAAAVQQYWEMPEQQAALRLEAAQAAAARSCAYLQCDNLLGFSGGPAAGEGVGSKRCSACRAVSYCGEACSHADWRAGHRRVCKALKDARQHAAA